MTGRGPNAIITPRPPMGQIGAVMPPPLHPFGFDGGDYGVRNITSGLPTGGDARTIVLWYRRDDVGAIQYLWAMSDVNFGEFSFNQLTAAEVNLVVNQSGNNYSKWTVAAQTLGTWRHYVMVYGGANDYWLSYNGGSLVTPVAQFGTIPNPLTGAINRLWVGADVQNASGMTGALAQVAIYAGAWTQDDVDNYWATLPIDLNKFTTSGPTLKAYYRGFSEYGQGQTIFDDSGTGNDMQNGSQPGPDANDILFEPPYHYLSNGGPV